MTTEAKPSSGAGLEASCGVPANVWLRSRGPENGVELLEAWFAGSGYHRHRHDTYAISLTTRGVQTFSYRGIDEASLPGQVVVLHPDEAHDGRPGTDDGFSYREIYVRPALIFEATQVLGGHRTSLPFVRSPVITNKKLGGALAAAFACDLEPLMIDSLLLRLAEGLLEADSSSGRAASLKHLDLAAVSRAREFLDAENARIVRSSELEHVTGLTRFELARQFRVASGTSPYRYHVMRRLDRARQRLAQRSRLVDVALDAGFADQAHFTRMFKATFGLTPAAYAIASVSSPSEGGPGGGS